MAPLVRAPHLLVASLMLSVLAGCSQAPQEVRAPAESSSTVAAPKPVSQTPGNCFVDQQKRSPSGLSLLGWAVGNPLEAPVAISVEVQSGGKTQLFATKFYDRPDIAKAYKNPELQRTGFITEIPAADAPAGAKAAIVIENSKEIYRCKNTFALQ